MRETGNEPLSRDLTKDQKRQYFQGTGDRETFPHIYAPLYEDLR
jgi:uncharacterized protein (DUF952 family)